MPDPLATLAALDAEERRLVADLLQLQARRADLVAKLAAPVVPDPPPPADLLDAADLVVKWKEAGLPCAPRTVRALQERLQRARTGERARWRKLLDLGEQHRRGQTLLWPWAEAERVIREERP